ncbi:MAG: TRAP transporter 4TM/12TM fusion protein [Alphaproteobacteria bacterium]|jgi:TRAP transporter 4TM/12TM fusion protein
MTDNGSTLPNAELTAEQAVEAADKVEMQRYRDLPWLANSWLIFAAAISILASIYMLFGLGNEFNSYVPLENEYFYFMIAVLLPLPFLIFPTGDPRTKKLPLLSVFPAALALTVPAYIAVKLLGLPALDAMGTIGNFIIFFVLLGLLAMPFYFRKDDISYIPNFDALLALLAFVVAAFFAFKGNDILEIGWEYDAPDYAKYLALIMWALILESARRAGGNAIFYVCLVMSVYPMLSDYAPGFLAGEPVAAATTTGFHIFGTESVLGIPMIAFANLVIGFLIFGVALQYTGGGAFFLNLAFALLGHHRGGPAKVAIFSSGLMGSMSGSVITNILTTGVMTIPAMKKVGFRPAYAGGVEACASTGGVLMPPVMGATAFVMATILEIPYAQIVIAAAFPSVLYYLGLYLQIDAYAARNDLRGLADEDLPRIGQVLKDGWYFIAVFIMLIVMLLYMQREAQAPYYATAVLLFINQFSPKHRWNWTGVVTFVRGVGLLFAELLAILVGVGLIMGSLSLTGKVGTITYELTQFADGNTLLLLFMAAVTSFVLGIGMTITAAYLFLAVTVAPALTDGGLDKLAVHLFLMYWGMISFITPPVAIGAFAAATVAKADPMKTGFEAMRLGSIIYFVPFFFVLNPALIGRGELSEIIIVLTATIAGITLIAGGLQGYLYHVGKLDGVMGMIGRILLVFGGIVLALPGNKIIGYNHWEINGTAAIIIAAAIAFSWLGRRDESAVQAA